MRDFVLAIFGSVSGLAAAVWLYPEQATIAKGVIALVGGILVALFVGWLLNQGGHRG